MVLEPSGGDFIYVCMHSLACPHASLDSYSHLVLHLCCSVIVLVCLHAVVAEANGVCGLVQKNYMHACY